MILVRYLGELLLFLGAVPLAYTAILTVAALIRPRRWSSDGIRTVVLVPAHNEESLIGALLGSLGTQVPQPHIVLVVAHRCSDRTAQVARELGAQVLELATGNEKADALKAGLKWLDQYEWDSVLVLDADCRIPSEFMSELRPLRNEIVQSRYLLDEDNPKTGLMYSFLRRLEVNTFHAGREVLGCLAFLQGTGMILGRDALQKAPWTAKGLTEDRMQTFSFLSAGVPIRLDRRLRVFAAPPHDLTESWNQRRRWLSSGVINEIRTACRTARSATPDIGYKSWELPLAVWADARSTWLLFLGLGTLLLALTGGSYVWGLLLLGIAVIIAMGLGIAWYRSLFFRVLLEAPRSVVVILGAAIFGMVGRRPTDWKRGR